MFIAMLSARSKRFQEVGYDFLKRFIGCITFFEIVKYVFIYHKRSNKKIINMYR